MTEILPEVAVADADAETRHIYERIMSLTGVGSPALIYRHFATFPGLLAWVWDIIGPELESGHIAGLALDAVARTPVVALPRVTDATFVATGVDIEGRQMIDGMLATYNRMNPINLSLITAIRTLIDPQAKSVMSATPLPTDIDAPMTVKAFSLPAPLNLDQMSDELRDTIRKLSAAIPSPGAPVIPTLYRHLAIWPAFLMHLAPGLLAAMQRGEIEARMQDLTTAMTPFAAAVAANARTRDMPAAPVSDPQSMLKTLDAFLYTIPQLIVVGAALRAAIPAYEA